MNEALVAQVRADLEALATRRQFERALDILTDRAEIRVYAPTDVDSKALCELLGLSDPSIRTSPVDIATLESHPEDAVIGEKAIAIWPAGALLTARDVAAMQAFLERPAGTRALVLLLPQHPMDEADIDAAAAAMWRLFFAKNGERWMHQDLGSVGCLFWGPSPQEPIADRVRSAGQSLCEWATQSTSDESDLAVLRLMTAIEAASDALTDSSTSTRPPPVRAGDTLLPFVTDVRRRSLSLIDATRASLDEHIHVSLQQLVLDLQRSVRSLLDEGAARHSTRVTPPAVYSRLEDELLTWQQRMRQEIEERLGACGDGIRGNLESIDWTEASRSLNQNIEPNAFCPPLALPALDIRLAASSDPRPQAPRAQPPVAPAPAWQAPARIAVWSGALAAVSVIVAPVALPLAAAVGGAGGAVAGGLMERRIHHSPRPAETGGYFRVISETADAARRSLHDSVNSTIDSARQSMVGEFDRLERDLSGRVHPDEAEATPDRDAEDREALALMRRQLSSMASGTT